MAASGEAAVDYLHDNRVDVVILDMIMDPGMDGLDTFKQILEIHPDQKAVIASGFSQTKRVNAAIRLGAGPYIKKPYTWNTLGQAVRAALDGHP
jgi:DNA-binding NarL/FixJ family response regulator